MGFNVVVIDVDDFKLEFVKSLGVDVGINVLKVDVKEVVFVVIGEGCYGVFVIVVFLKVFE